jgi:hypothetical protein
LDFRLAGKKKSDAGKSGKAAKKPVEKTPPRSRRKIRRKLKSS